MLLFKPVHVPLILSGHKTMTMRRGKRRWRVGSVHQCRTQLFKVEPFARVRILKVYQQRLGELTEEQYRREGNYTAETYIAVWKKINKSYDPNEVNWAVEFELAESEGRK